MTALKFEMMESLYQHGRWDVLEGDIKGSIHLSNLTLQEVLDFVKERMTLHQQTPKQVIPVNELLNQISDLDKKHGKPEVLYMLRRRLRI